MNEIKRNEKVHNMKMIASWSKTKYGFFHEVNVLSEKVVLWIMEDIYFNQKLVYDQGS